jgi:hypothetical protein
MASTARRISDLIVKELREGLSDSEKSELDQWKCSSASNMALFNSLTNEDELHASIKEMYKVDIEAGWKRLQSRFPSTLGDAPFGDCAPEKPLDMEADPAAMGWEMYPIDPEVGEKTQQFQMTIKFSHACDH